MSTNIVVQCSSYSYGIGIGYLKKTSNWYRYLFRLLCEARFLYQAESVGCLSLEVGGLLGC